MIPSAVELYQPVLDATLQALSNILTPEGLMIVVLGTLFGMFFGALPGFGGFLALALILPLSYQLSPELGFLSIAATLGGTAFGGSLPAITLNIPGLPQNIATCWDGNQMAKKGESTRAIGVSATASFLGSLVGLVFVFLLLPVIREIVLLFAGPEIFAAALVGLFVIGFAGKRKPVKGTVALLFGLTLAFVGIQGATNVERFTLDIPYLIAGVSVVPVAVGMYAIAESAKLTFHMDRIAGSGDVEFEDSSVLEGVRDVFVHRWLFLRSVTVGWVVGLLPGVGGSLANVLAYSVGKNASSDPDSWGTGIPEGVIAPEASNDAKDGGAVIPTIAFGIPGSGAQVFFLAGMILNGLYPGQDMLVENLHITMTILLGLFLSNALTSLIGLGFGAHFTKITRIPTTPMAGAILLISLLGTFTLQNNMYDIYMTLLFGVIGYLMWRYSYPRILVVIAVVLGPILDRTYVQSIQIYGSGFLLRPIPILIFGLFVLSLVSLYSSRSLLGPVRTLVSTFRRSP